MKYMHVSKQGGKKQAFGTTTALHAELWCDDHAERRGGGGGGLKIS